MSALHPHLATVHWQRTATDVDFLKGKYSREHTWTFDGGITIQASPSSIVPVPYSNPAFVDPEEAFVAAISSCHMLTFLFIASRRGFVVESYDDTTAGTMTKNEKGIYWVSSVLLRPQIVFSAAKTPSAEDLTDLHHFAHEQCFIAHSVKSEITVQPRP